MIFLCNLAENASLPKTSREETTLRGTTVVKRIWIDQCWSKLDLPLLSLSRFLFAFSSSAAPSWTRLDTVSWFTWGIFRTYLQSQDGGQYRDLTVVWTNFFISAFVMVILGRFLVFVGLTAILHAGYSAVQCTYFPGIRQILNKELSQLTMLFQLKL